MEIYTPIKFAHIIFGTAALISGPIAMLNQNGGKLHRTSGNIYFYSMLFIVASSFYMSIEKQNWFLFYVGAFSFYLVMTGTRSLKLKKLHAGQKPLKLDWIILITSVIFSVLLIFMGVKNIAIFKNSFGIVPLTFGLLMIRFCYRDYKRFKGINLPKNYWLFVHIGNMIGGYIATFTAFLVNNIQTEPAFIGWIAPTIVFTPVIFYSINKFKKKSVKQETIKFERGEY